MFFSPLFLRELYVPPFWFLVVGSIPIFSIIIFLFLSLERLQVTSPVQESQFSNAMIFPFFLHNTETPDWGAHFPFFLFFPSNILSLQTADESLVSGGRF